MKACGIIVEYNPFHNGHLYHLEQARAITGCDVLVAVEFRPARGTGDSG